MAQGSISLFRVRDVVFGNDMTVAAARRLSHMLRECTALTHLNMGVNKMGSDGMGELAEGLKECHVANPRSTYSLVL